MLVYPATLTLLKTTYLVELKVSTDPIHALVFQVDEAGKITGMDPDSEDYLGYPGVAEEITNTVRENISITLNKNTTVVL